MKLSRLFPALLVFIIAACQPVPQRPEYPMPRYDNLPRIPIRAASLQVVQQYQPPMQAPNVEHLMPIPPSASVEQWIRDRVQLVGDNGTVTFTIRDAHVTSQQLPKTTGIKGAFTKDQAELLLGHLAVDVHLDTNIPVATYADADTEVSVKKSLPEGVSLQERDSTYYALMKDITQRFAAAIEPQLRARFNPGGAY